MRRFSPLIGENEALERFPGAGSLLTLPQVFREAIGYIRVTDGKNDDGLKAFRNREELFELPGIEATHLVDGEAKGDCLNRE